MSRFFYHIKVLILLTAMRVFSIIPRVGKVSREQASRIVFREENIDFAGLADLKNVSFLFITDTHIGGNVDALSAEIATGTEGLLRNRKKDHIFALHGGDFVSSEGPKKLVGFENFKTVAPRLFRGLNGYRNYGVIGNHDEENRDFPVMKEWLQENLNMHFMAQPADEKRVPIEGKNICIHGMHTLSDHLHTMQKKARNILMDQYIERLNNQKNDINIVLIHNPDGVQFLLDRLIETDKKITKPTLFLAGHTHGGMFDVRGLRKFGLMACKTFFGRYKGWYQPSGKYAETGNWKMYVSTGVGNTPGCDFRLNATPEVVLFTL